MKKHVNPLYVLITGIVFILIASMSEKMATIILQNVAWGKEVAYGIGAALGLGGFLFFVSGLVGVIKNMLSKSNNQ